MKTALAFFVAFTITAITAIAAGPELDLLREDVKFAQRSLATFDQKLAAARAAGVAEADTLYPELGAVWVHGDVARVRATLAKIDRLAIPPPKDIGRFCPPLDFIRTALAGAEKDPTALNGVMKKSRAAWLQTMAFITREDLRQIDSSIDQWAIENNKLGGVPLGWAEVSKYIKLGSRLQRTGATVFGDAYGPRFITDTPPVVPAATWEMIKEVVPAKYFTPFPVAGEAIDKK